MRTPGRTKLATISLITGLGLAAVAAGCSGTQGGKSSAAAIAAPPASRAAAPNRAAAGSPPPAPGVDLAVAKRPGGDRRIISTAQLSLQARDIDQAVQRATTLVVAAQGYVFSESASLATGQHAHVVFKVVPGDFNDVVQAIGKLGRLTQRQIATEDVTGQVVDLNARLAAAQTSADRLRQLLAASGGVSDLLSVEQQLTTRDGQVDSLSGELATLRAQVDMATITLDVSPVTKRPAAVVSHHEQPGFARGLRAGATAFANTARVVEAAFGVLLPFAPIGLLLLAGWWIARRRGTTATDPS
jgi:hypothetical protein